MQPDTAFKPGFTGSGATQTRVHSSIKWENRVQDGKSVKSGFTARHNIQTRVHRVGTESTRVQRAKDNRKQGAEGPKEYFVH